MSEENKALIRRWLKEMDKISDCESRPRPWDKEAGKKVR